MIKQLSTPLKALALSMGLVGMSASATVVEYEGWLHGEEADKAIELAAEQDLPIALMRQWRETDCPKCKGAGSVMASAKPNRQMVRVILYVGEGADQLNSEKTKALFRKVAGQVKDPSGWIADTFYTQADGTILGFVPYEDANQASEEGKKVLQIAEWKSSVPNDIAKADKLAERGRYEQALAAIDQVISQDAQISHMIQVMVGKAEEDSKQPDKPVSSFFPELREQKVKAYKALAQAELDAARQLVSDEKLREAQRALRDLARGPQDFETTAAAQKLLEEVELKLRRG